MDRTETINRLNELLEAERAGVETLADLAKTTPKGYWRNELVKIEADEAWSCALLHRAVERLGGQPSDQTNDFAAKVRAQPTLPDQLRLLSRGQSWVVKRLDGLLATELDAEIAAWLREMREEHVINVEWCDHEVERLSGAGTSKEQ